MIVISIYGILFKLLRIDLLRLKKQKESYWLDIEKIKLESSIVDANGFNTMQLSQVAITPKNPIKPDKRRIVLLAFIGGFMISILSMVLAE